MPPDEDRRGQLRELDADARTKKVPWVEYAVIAGTVAFLILTALFFLTRNVPHGLFSDATNSVSGAPGP